MATVTSRIKQIKQPYGGYLPVRLFQKHTIDDEMFMYEQENIHTSLIGMAVDYLTRFIICSNVDEAFHISMMGAKAIGKEDVAVELKNRINKLDEESIIAACKLVGFDVCYRNGLVGYKPIEEINPDSNTIHNIQTMVLRSVAMLFMHKPIVSIEPTFEGGYTELVSAGDGDYITHDCLWDLKVSKSPPNSSHTLQLVMYYLMGLHSVHDYYKNIKYLRIYNPRSGTIYTCKISDIDKSVLSEVEKVVIGYETSIFENQVNQQNKNSSKNKCELVETRTIKKTVTTDGLFPKEYIETTVIKTIKSGDKQYSEITKKVTSGVNNKKTHQTDKKVSDYTIEDVMEKTGKSRADICLEIQKGNLSAEMKNGKYHISKLSLESYLQGTNQVNDEKAYLWIGLISVMILVLLLLII